MRRVAAPVLLLALFITESLSGAIPSSDGQVFPLQRKEPPRSVQDRALSNLQASMPRNVRLIQRVILRINSQDYALTAIQEMRDSGLRTVLISPLGTLADVLVSPTGTIKESRANLMFHPDWVRNHLARDTAMVNGYLGKSAGLKLAADGRPIHWRRTGSGDFILYLFSPEGHQWTRAYYVGQKTTESEVHIKQMKDFGGNFKAIPSEIHIAGNGYELDIVTVQCEEIRDSGQTLP